MLRLCKVTGNLVGFVVCFKKKIVGRAIHLANTSHSNHPSVMIDWRTALGHSVPGYLVMYWLTPWCKTLSAKDCDSDICIKMHNNLYSFMQSINKSLKTDLLCSLLTLKSLCDWKEMNKELGKFTIFTIQYSYVEHPQDWYVVSVLVDKICFTAAIKPSSLISSCDDWDKHTRLDSLRNHLFYPWYLIISITVIGIPANSHG